MEAKDTVLESLPFLLLNDLFPINDEDKIKELYSRIDKMRMMAAQAQAESSFRAGYREAQDGIWDKVMGAKKSGFDEGKREGIREIVEWMKTNMQLERCDPDVMAYFQDYVWVDYKEWQAKLKEWGIE